MPTQVHTTPLTKASNNNSTYHIVSFVVLTRKVGSCTKISDWGLMCSAPELDIFEVFRNSSTSLIVHKKAGVAQAGKKAWERKDETSVR